MSNKLTISHSFPNLIDGDRSQAKSVTASFPSSSNISIYDITDEPYILYSVGENPLGESEPSGDAERVYVPPPQPPVPIEDDDSTPFYEELWFILLLIILLLIILIALIICCCLTKKGGKYPGKRDYLIFFFFTYGICFSFVYVPEIKFITFLLKVFIQNVTT